MLYRTNYIIVYTVMNVPDTIVLSGLITVLVGVGLRVGYSLLDHHIFFEKSLLRTGDTGPTNRRPE